MCRFRVPTTDNKYRIQDPLFHYPLGLPGGNKIKKLVNFSLWAFEVQLNFRELSFAVQTFVTNTPKTAYQ